MNCPKCNIQLPDDSVFCPNCGCNIEETKKQIYFEQMSEDKAQATETIVITKNKTNKVLVVFLVISIIICCILGYFTFSFYNQNEEKIDIINGYENDIKSLKASNNTLRKQYSEILLGLKSSDNWGYATENFHANTGVVCTTAYGKRETIKITMNYSNTTCTVDCSDSSVANVFWSDKTWNYGEAGEVYIAPRSEGVCVLTFTNDAYKSTFKVLVIVT